MKKRSILYLLLLICSTGLLFSSCGKEDIKGDPDQEQGGGDDDTDNPVLPVEKELAGTYKGLLSILVDGNKLGDDAVQKIYISKSALGDNLLKLELKDFTFGIPIGDINVDSCAVTLKDNIYSFSGNVTLTFAAPIGTCPINVEGTIEESNININITVAVAALGQDVVAKFEGSKMTGNENTEAKILTYTFDNNLITEQPAIDEDNGEITLKVIDSATDDDLKALVPTITISEKATIIPASEEAQDFSNGKKVTYTVVSEDGTVKTYKVYIAGSQSVLKYSFEEWSDILGGNHPYYNPKPEDELATPNKGVALLYTFKYTGEYPVLKEEKGVNGMGIKLVTRYTKTSSTIPPTITAGSLFTGEMKIGLSSLSKPLESTHFGILYKKKPISFKGYYKYTPGEEFRDGTNKGDVVVEGQVDECSIKAILYQVESEAEYLDGTNINTSPKRVAIAELPDGTAKAEYTSFDIPFVFETGKEYDPSKIYKLAIICTASKEGDLFKGAPNSTLILDELEVIGE